MKITTAPWMKSKWFRIGVPVALIMLAIGLYTLWSITTWNNYQARFTGLQNDAQSKIKSALDLKVETSEERAKKLDALKAARDSLPEDKNALCEVNPLVDWQNLVGNLREQKERCSETKASLVGIRGTLSKVVEYLDSEHALANVLSKLPAGGEVAEGEWVKQRDGYKAVQKSVTDLQVSSGFASVKQTATEKLTAVVAAWDEILAAHDAKDKARYTKAAATLAASYDGLSAIGATSTGHLQPLIEFFKEGYARL